MSRNSIDARDSWRAALAIIIVICLFDFRIFRYLHLEHLESLLDVPEQIVRGTPHWRAFQNRVLGPYMVAGVSGLFGISFQSATILTYCVLCYLANCVVLGFLRSLQPSRGWPEALRDLVVFNFLVLGLSHNWFYPWDFGEIILPVVFLRLVREPDVSLLKLCALFVVWILNRETGVLLGVWLVVDAVVQPRDRWRKVAAGIAMVAVGLAVVYALRSTLFVQSSLPLVGADLDSRLLGGNHFALLLNIESIPNQDVFSKESVNLVILACLVPAAWVLRRGIRAHLSVFVFMCMLFVADISFGRLHEMRIYYHLVPFFFFFGYADSPVAAGSRREGAEAPDSTALCN